MILSKIIHWSINENDNFHEYEQEGDRETEKKRTTPIYDILIIYKIFYGQKH